MADPALERKYALLRRRLDHLGYRQALGFESMPLVERLFADLVHTTESLKTAKGEIAQAKKETSVWEHQVEPLRRDNSRLISENNHLHVRIIELREESVAREKELKETLHRAESESRDLRFLNAQYAQRLREDERRDVAKSLRIEELIEKNLGAVISTPDGSKRAFPPRRARIEMKSPAKPSQQPKGAKPDSRPSTAQRLPPSEAEINAVEIAERRMDRLAAEVEQLKGENARLESQLGDAGARMSAYREEIERLGRELEARRDVNRVHVDEMLRERERQIVTLRNQIDVLEGRFEREESSVAALAGSDDGRANNNPENSLAQEQALAERVIVQNRELMGKLRRAQALLKGAREAYCDVAGVHMDDAEFAAAVEARETKPDSVGAAGVALRDIESKFGELQRAVNRFQERNEELERQVELLRGKRGRDVDAGFGSGSGEDEDDGYAGSRGGGGARRDERLIAEIAELKSRNGYLCRELEAIQDLMLRMDATGGMTGGAAQGRASVAQANPLESAGAAWLSRVRMECLRLSRVLGGQGHPADVERQSASAAAYGDEPASPQDLSSIERSLSVAIDCATECVRLREHVTRLENAAERHLAEERMWRTIVDQANVRRDALAAHVTELESELETVRVRLDASEKEVDRLTRSREQLLEAVESMADGRAADTSALDASFLSTRASLGGDSSFRRSTTSSPRHVGAFGSDDGEGSVIVQGEGLDESGRMSAGRAAHVDLLRRVLESNDQLERRLEESERKLGDLAKEREKILLLYREAIDAPMGEGGGTAGAAGTDSHLARVVTELEAERDTLSATLKRTKLECEQLRLRLARATAQATSQQQQQQARSKASDSSAASASSSSVGAADEGLASATGGTAFAIVQKENRRMVAELIEARRAQDEAAEALRSEKAARAALEGELDAAKRRAGALSAALERANDDVAELRANLDVVEGRAQEADGRAEALSVRTKAQADEILRLRAALTSLDKQRDELDDESAQYIETIAELRAQVDVGKSLAAGKERECEELRREAERAVARLRETEREFGALRTIHDRLQRDFERAEKERGAAEAEVRRVRSEDVERLQRENQSLHRDLEAGLREREELAKNVQRMAKELLDVNELMSMKERERAALMDSMRSLSDEREDLEDSIRDVSREKREAVTRAEASERLIEDLRRRLADVARREEAYTADVSEFTEHAEALSQTILELETRLKACMEERDGLRRDLQAARDLATNAGRSRESLQRRVASLEAELERARAAIADMAAAKDAGSLNVAAERGARSELENVVAGLRSDLARVEGALRACETERDLLVRRAAIADERVRDLSARISETAHGVEDREREREALRRQVEDTVAEMDGLRAQLDVERKTIRELRQAMDRQSEVIRQQDDDLLEMRRRAELSGIASEVRIAQEEQRSHRVHEQYRHLIERIEQAGVPTVAPPPTERSASPRPS